MKPRSYTSEGIVLARRDYGEADRILVLYTKNFGRSSFIAKGVRRLKSKKRGHVEIFNQIRFQAITGRGLDLMTEADIVNDFKEVRKSLKKVSLAYYFVEVIGRITHDHEPNIELYNLVLASLNSLRINNSHKNLRLDFILSLLTIMGYWPKGKILYDHDIELEKVIERQVSSVRVGKRMLE